jgi:putative redox protein
MITGNKIPELLVSETRLRKHKVLSGLVAKYGGFDEAPNPHELIEIALAACTILTAQLYANRKGIPLLNTTCSVKIINEGKDTLLEREIRFDGDLTREQKIRLFEIVEKCPVHNFLESNITIQSRVQE